MTLAALATALATGLGAIPVFLLGQRAAALRPLLAGIAIGAMVVAALAGLIGPAADDGSAGEVAAGVGIGIGFVLVARGALTRRRDMHATAGLDRSSLLVFGVLLVHSLPEGLAVGAAWASETAGLGLFVVLAISLQNVPEGTAIALPMEAAGRSARSQVSAAILSSLPQPIGAAFAFVLVEQAEAVLPLSLAFAGGAMLTVVVVELLPDALGGSRRRAAAGALAGAIAMLALSRAVGV